MDVKQLTALVTVAEAGSVSQAARLLHLVQPAVTRQIRLLEDEMGVALFERARQGMTPTAAGAALIVRARNVLQELADVQAEIRPEPARAKGVVTVGLLGTTMELLAERLVANVATSHPGISLRLVTAYSGQMRQWLDDGEVDLAMLYRPDTLSSTMVPLFDEDLWVVARPSDELSPDRPLTWEEVLAQPLVLPVTGYGLREVFERARAHLTPRIVFETNSLHLQKAMVLRGVGWTVLPAGGVAADVAAGRFSCAPLANPPLTRSIVLGMPRCRRVPAATEVTARELRRLIRELLRAGEWPTARLSA